MKKFELPKLPYPSHALEPVISKDIMELHHGKHHLAYVNNLNGALEKFEKAQTAQDLNAMAGLVQAIKFNGGGHINHADFWENLAPQGEGGGGRPQGDLLKAIEQAFGSFDVMVEKMSAKTTAIQGSGWGWLAFIPETKGLMLTTTSNQDMVHPQGLIPLLGIDVWEHAYYLQYKNARPEYVNNIWKIVNWKRVSERYNPI